MEHNKAPAKCIMIFSMLFVLSCWFSTAAAVADEFSADVTQKFGNKTMSGKFYMKGDKMRNEMVMMGTTRASIVRKDKGVVWVIMPQRQKYMEMPFTEEAKNNPQFYQDKLADIATKEDLGTEEINGFKCEKSLYTFKDTARGTMTQWYSKKLEFPLKIVMKGSNWEMITEYSNIKKGDLADSLFELPEGYTKMEMPANAPGMQRPGMGGHGMGGAPQGQ